MVGFHSQTKGPGWDPEGVQSGSTLEWEAACGRLNTQDQVDQEAQLEEEASLNDPTRRLSSVCPHTAGLSGG